MKSLYIKFLALLLFMLISYIIFENMESTYSRVIIYIIFVFAYVKIVMFAFRRLGID